MSNQTNMEDFGKGLWDIFSTALGGAVGGGGMIIGDRILYTSSQTLIVADHEALAPAGFELFAWLVRTVGGGGGSSANRWGLGGLFEEDIILKSQLDGATTAAVVVGAGGVGAAGGNSSFAGLCVALGGQVSESGAVPGWHKAKTLFCRITASSGPIEIIKEGCFAGANIYSGDRGGAGGESTFAYRLGGAVHPHPNALAGQGTASSQVANLGGRTTFPSITLAQLLGTFAGGNPLTARAEPGHAGIGDRPGGGGNGSDIAAGGAGGVPGGGAGGGTTGTTATGGRGQVVLYPLFRKEL